MLFLFVYVRQCREDYKKQEAVLDYFTLRDPGLSKAQTH